MGEVISERLVVELQPVYGGLCQRRMDAVQVQCFPSKPGGDMARITIDEQQARILLESSGEIEVRDRHGNRLEYAACSFSAEEIAEAKRRLASSGPWYTTQQVLDHFASPRSNVGI